MGKLKELLMDNNEREQDLLIAELDHENRLMRARNERLERELSEMKRKEWVGLTDEEVVDLKMRGRDLEFVSMTALRRFAQDIEAKLKQKNETKTI